MEKANNNSASLAFKPDLAEAARRWEAFHSGSIIDRPVVCVTAPQDNAGPIPSVWYRETMFGDIGEVIDTVVRAASMTFYGGEAIPTFSPSLGPDEVAAFCGGDLLWSGDARDTNWSAPFVADWEKALPLKINKNSRWWIRSQELHRVAAEKMAGKMNLCALDLHTNMDLLAAARGPGKLCTDLLDCPEWIDAAMESARAVFRELWEGICSAGRLLEPAVRIPTTLQCDFSCMIGPQMFRRWVLPALEEEAAIVGRTCYHWDGPGALTHEPDLVKSKGLHTLSYVPGTGRGSHVDHLDLLKRIQKGGKAVFVWGSADEIKQMHRELKPEKVVYSASLGSRSEAEALLEWFVKNT